MLVLLPALCLRMKIDIQTDDELNKLLDALAGEIVDAQIYHRLFCDLTDSIAEYSREFLQSNTFWSLTLDSLKEARLIRLCRVFDQNSTGLNLVNLLETIKANSHFFQEEHFRDHLRNNAFIDSLAETDRVPAPDQLDADIEYASSKNPLVKKLMVWRNKIIAHRDVKISLGKTQILESNPPSQFEIENLLNQSLLIFNRYSSLYKASTHGGVSSSGSINATKRRTYTGPRGRISSNFSSVEIPRTDAPHGSVLA
jgi:hypothetical protein